jgi:hypothetical protein
MPMSTAVPDPEARRLLGDAEQAAGTLERYAFSLNLTQKLEPVSGAEGEAAEEAATESEGRVEVRPRRVDQTVRVAFEGEWMAEYRTILVPEGAYVYESGLEEWARVPKEEAAEMLDTLSDFQVDLPEAVRQVAALGPAAAGRNEGGVTVRYEGSGEEAHRFATRLLESTFAWSQQEESTRESLEVRHLLAELVLDPERQALARGVPRGNGGRADDGRSGRDLRPDPDVLRHLQRAQRSRGRRSAEGSEGGAVAGFPSRQPVNPPGFGSPEHHFRPSAGAPVDDPLRRPL